MNEKHFNPVDYFFTWTEDWFEWDFVRAEQKARQDANELYFRLRRERKNPRKRTLKNQLITRGGIGSGHPQIEQIVDVFYVTWEE